MSSLQSLPLELRQKIYTLAITPLGTNKIEARSRQQGFKSGLEEVALPVIDDGHAQHAPNTDTALMRVSKQVSVDARPILYGCYKFTFQNCRALELFLDQIGDMKQHLRHVAIATGGYEHDDGLLYGATKRSFAMLATATGLQTLSVSHFDFCCSDYSPQPNADFENFVGACARLLQATLDARNAKGLKVNLTSILDIVKIVLPDCSGCCACGKAGIQYVMRQRAVCFKDGRVKKRRRCRCKCLEAERNNEVLMEQFKHSVALKLHSG